MTKENARNDKKVLGRPCDLTLFWLLPKRPSPCEGEGPEGEVCHSYLVMPSAASMLPRYAERSEASMLWIPYCVRNDRKEQSE